MNQNRRSSYKDKSYFEKNDYGRMHNSKKFKDYGLNAYYNKINRGSRKEINKEKSDLSYSYNLKPRSPIFSRGRHNYGFDQYKRAVPLNEIKKSSLNFDYDHKPRKSNFDHLNKIYHQKAQEYGRGSQKFSDKRERKKERIKAEKIDNYNNFKKDMTPKGSNWIENEKNKNPFSKSPFIKKNSKLSPRNPDLRLRYSQSRNSETNQSRRSKSELRYARSQKEIVIPKKTPVKPNYNIFSKDYTNLQLVTPKGNNESSSDLKLFNRRLEDIEKKLKTIEKKRLSEKSQKYEIPGTKLEYFKNLSKSSKEIPIMEPTPGSGDSFSKQKRRIRNPKFGGFKYSANQKMSGTKEKYFITSFDWEKKDDMKKRINGFRKYLEKEEELRGSKWRKTATGWIGNRKYRGSFKETKTKFNKTTTDLSQKRARSKSNRDFSKTTNNFSGEKNEDEKSRFKKLLNSGGGGFNFTQNFTPSSKFSKLINSRQERSNSKQKRLLKGSDYPDMRLILDREKNKKNIFKGCSLKKVEKPSKKPYSQVDIDSLIERNVTKEKYLKSKKKDEKEEKKGNAVERRNSFYSYNGEEVAFLEKIRSGDYKPSVFCPGFGKYLSDCRKQLSVVGDVKHFMSRHPDCAKNMKKLRLKRNFRSIYFF